VSGKSGAGDPEFAQAAQFVHPEFVQSAQQAQTPLPPQTQTQTHEQTQTQTQPETQTQTEADPPDAAPGFDAGQLPSGEGEKEGRGPRAGGKGCRDRAKALR
jgi:dsRNA-specific ribonuclease